MTVDSTNGAASFFARQLEMTAYLFKRWDYRNNTELQIYFILGFTMANCTVLFFTFFVGLAANVFVIWAVVHQKSLQTSNNALLVNLAIIDLIRCAIDCPLLLFIVLRGHGVGHPGVLLCDAQMVSFSFSCCVQLLTLASISAERYQAIANPFQTKERRRRIMVWIPLTWTVALLLSVLCMTTTKDAPAYLKCRGIQMDILPDYNTFGRYILIPVWFACFAVVIGFYGRIFYIVRTHNRKIFDQGVFPPPKSKPEPETADGKEAVDAKASKVEEPETNKTDNLESKEEVQKLDSPPVAAAGHQPVAVQTEERISAQDGLLSNGNPTTLTPANTVIASQEPATSRPPSGKVMLKKGSQPKVTLEKHTKMVSLEVTTSVPTTVESGVLIDLEGSKVDSAPDANSGVDVKPEDVPPSSVVEAPKTDSEPNPPAAAEDEEVAGAVCMMPSLANRERASKNKEGKLAKRSGYIILTFLLFWSPLVVSVFVNFFVHRYKNPPMQFAMEVEILSVSVACMTSATNPITYAVVNPQFRTEFRNLRAKCNIKKLCSKP